jgi:hypothetical protein
MGKKMRWTRTILIPDLFYFYCDYYPKALTASSYYQSLSIFFSSRYPDNSINSGTRLSTFYKTYQPVYE